MSRASVDSFTLDGLVPITIIPADPTEQALLELAEDFKERMGKKINEITELKKFICLIYGLCRVADDNEDASMLSLCRDQCSIALQRFCNIGDEPEV